MKLINFSALFWGLSGALGITAVFYLVQALGMQSWSGPLYFSKTKWYFILPLIIGFGVQVALFRAIHLKAKRGGGTLLASGGVSTGAMVACCMHNLVTLLPILGLTGAAVFFSTYQNYVFSFSILFVVAGVIYMIRKYKKIHSGCKL